MGGRLRGGGEQAAAFHFQSVEVVEECDLTGVVELVDVVHGQLPTPGVRPQGRVTAGIDVVESAGEQQVRFSRTRFAPQQQHGFIASGSQPGHQAGQGLIVAAADKIVEAGSCFGQQVKDKLAHVVQAEGVWGGVQTAPAELSSRGPLLLLRSATVLNREWPRQMLAISDKI